ncbi:hypothetical protein HZH66_011972 [Vespula vulgaris]|uniref:Uncharacterized protein n=1 Tax=Vespula vulgaris TaxID=7454 RepID=A0A834JG26_VESVU|nr:hypothetical protein HZH66_011972 [Vespula vulgaris]
MDMRFQYGSYDVSNAYDIAEELNTDHKTVLNHLKKFGHKKKLDVPVSHDLIMKNLIDRVSTYESLLKRNEIKSFLKWLIMDNNVRKRS